MGPYGKMRDNLVAQKSYDGKAVLLWDDSAKGARRLVSWVLMFDEGHSTPTAFFYTKKQHRNHGYATILMRSVKDMVQQPSVHPWSLESAGFFSKFHVKNVGDTRLANKRKVC